MFKLWGYGGQRAGSLAPGRMGAQTTVVMHQMLALLAPIALLWPGQTPAPWRDAPAQQVRIEQHLSIRISPGAPDMPPDMLMELREEPAPEHFVEHKRGKCLPANGIAAVDSAEGNRLLLFMHSSEIITGTLEKGCKARDFYSGFYVERHADGQICVNRDRLQSRSGASCKLKALHDLIASGR